MQTVDFKALRVFAEEIRVASLKEFKALGFGHVGGSMSVIEALAVLYGQEMKVDPKNPHMEDRDWLVMSKGHAGPSVYATLALKGFFPVEMLQTLNKPGTNLPSHCDRTKTPGVDMTTGSLGQGTSEAVGVALGNKIAGRDSYTYLFVGDGEANEGQVWEAAASAVGFGLDHLICFVDDNKQQLDGYTYDVMPSTNLGAKFQAFGWHTQWVDGHDIPAIYHAIEKAKSVKGVPSCIVLNTIKGKGCTIALEAGICHSLQFNDEKIDGAIAAAEEVLAACKA